MSTAAKFSVTLSKKGDHLVFSKTVFEDGFELDRKMAILMIDPEYDADEVLESAKEYNWIFGSEKNQSGFYPIKRGAKIAEPA